MKLWTWLKGLFGFRQEEESRSVADLGLLPTRLAVPADDFLQRVRDLQRRNARWDAIWQVLNPDDDPEVQRLLVELRGPHLFAPQVALNILEEGCQRALAKDPGADRLAALEASRNTGDPFVRPD